MEFEVNNIEEIVELIMKKMDESNISTAGNSKNGVFDNVDEAIEEAKKAQAILFSSKLELREKIIASNLFKHNLISFPLLNYCNDVNKITFFGEPSIDIIKKINLMK